MVTHLEPDILDCEVKWASGSFITSNVWWSFSWAISNPKDDAVKVLHSIWQLIWKTQQWPQDWKRSVFIPIPKKGNAKKCSNYCTIALISHASKCMLKILQARLQQYVNWELPDVFNTSCILKGQRNQRSNCQHSLDHGTNKGIPEKHLLLFIDYAKTFDCVGHNKLKNS